MIAQSQLSRLVPANQIAALRFCIPLCSNVELARDWSQDIAVKSRTCTTNKLIVPMSPDTSPRGDLGMGWVQVKLKPIYIIDTCMPDLEKG